MIEKEDILHLGTLARIRLKDEEIDSFKDDINTIIEYVSVVSDIAGDTTELKKLGAVHNVFREDEVSTEPGQYTEDIVKEMPHTEGNYLKVKKILSQD